MTGISKSNKWLALSFLAIGLLAHVYAAHMVAGYRIAYLHHIGGFFFIAAVTGAVIYGAGRLFWKTRPDVTLLVFAAVQAILGLAVVFNQLHHSN